MTRCRLLLAFLLALPAVKADVLVVDAAGGGDFTSLAAAVAAAADGDTLLVRDGSYVEPSPIVIEGKALTITGEYRTEVFDIDVSIQPGLVVHDLPATKNVVLQNLRVVGAPSTIDAAATPALAVSDTLSHVRVQNCYLIGGSGVVNPNEDGAPAVTVTGALSTALVHCAAIGGSGQFSPSLHIKTGHGGAGITMAGGPVLVSHSSAQGGPGGSNIIGAWPNGGAGGAGIAHSSGTLLMVGGNATGGDGGTAHTGGAGGHGLAIGGTGAALMLGGAWSNGGTGGGSDDGPNGANGLPVNDPLGLLAAFGGTLHEFDLTSPLREGQSGTIDFGGNTTDTTLLFASLQLHQLPFVGYQGVLMLMPTALIGPFPFAPPGNQNVPLVGPALPAGVESLLVHVQPAYLGTDGTVLGAGVVLTLLDAAF